jgi:aminopeptidase N
VAHYSGQPKAKGRFGGIAFREDPAGRPWIYTACEGEGSSIWWPSKDQWRDEPESMDISVAVPNELTDVSNGRFLGKTDLGDGYTRWDWRVHYPINSYNVSLNIAAYEHFSDALGDLTLDFYALPEDLDKAKVQFAQVKPMLEAFLHYFGDYPFVKDGYKLIQVPYTGMEHQSAVTYGNGFQNGYGGRDWTGVGVSPKFDFIIIHESGHEWFGNAVSAADVSDMWIHEGWTTYLESMYVERLFGAEDALKYINGYKSKVQNRQPIITPRGVHRTPSQDMYFKGALFLHTLRGILNDDDKWFALVRDIYQSFKYQNILTEDLLPKFNECFQRDMAPIFGQYLRQAQLPVLQLAFDEPAGMVKYRWQADQPGFNMPIRVGRRDEWQTIEPTSEWQSMATSLDKQAFDVDEEWFYVEVQKTTTAELDQADSGSDRESGGD